VQQRTPVAPTSMLAACASRACARLVDGGYRAWQIAQLESEIALTAWRLAGTGHAAAAHRVYVTALDHEATVARELEVLCRVTRALTSR